MQTETHTSEVQDIRAKYRTRTESTLEPFQLAALLMQRALTHGQPDELRTINVIAIDAATLSKIAKALQSLAVAQCNREWTKRDETRRLNLAKEAHAIAEAYGLTVTTHGDPRGYVVRLHGDGIYRNGWGDGFGVA